MELEIYLGVLSFFLIGVSLACATHKKHNTEGWWVLLVTGSVLGLGIVSFLGGLMGGKPITEYRSASSIRSGNEIIVQAEGFPTQIVSDMKFIDKKLMIVRTIRTNVWGSTHIDTPKYTVEIDQK